jgi:hypothetical protein
MVYKVFRISLLKLSYLLFFLLFFSGIFNAVDIQDNLYLLEKDYLLLKNQFEGYFLDFPEIDFILLDYNDLSQYQTIIEKYDSLPRLEVVSVNDSFQIPDFFLDGYTVDFNSLTISKKETLLRVFQKNNIEEYLYVEYYLSDLNLYYDFSKEIISSSDSLKSFNTFYIIDKNLSYLTKDLSKSYSPFKISKKEIVIIEKKDYTLLYFFIIVIVLLLIYFYKYFKENPTFSKKIKKRIRNLILKIINKN